jgi:hypothetical protein
MCTCSVLCSALASACMPAVAISTPGALQEAKETYPFALCDGFEQCTASSSARQTSATGAVHLKQLPLTLL